MKKLRAILADRAFVKNYVRNAMLGKLCKFDEKFFSQFEGMYFQGLPIYFHLSPFMAKGKCYDASATLGLAFGKGCYICRGDLRSQLKRWGEGQLGHGWVEKDGYVYDTTWQVVCEKSAYEKVFKPANVVRQESSAFFDECKGISDWTIHDKGWYEENYSTANLLIFQVREYAKGVLAGSDLENGERTYFQKLLKDLPDDRKAKRESFSIDGKARDRFIK